MILGSNELLTRVPAYHLLFSIGTTTLLLVTAALSAPPSASPSRPMEYERKPTSTSSLAESHEGDEKNLSGHSGSSIDLVRAEAIEYGITPVFLVKSQLINEALSEIGMGRYQWKVR